MGLVIKKSVHRIYFDKYLSKNDRILSAKHHLGLSYGWGTSSEETPIEKEYKGRNPQGVPALT